MQFSRIKIKKQRSGKPIFECGECDVRISKYGFLTVFAQSKILKFKSVKIIEMTDNKMFAVILPYTKIDGVVDTCVLVLEAKKSDHRSIEQFFLGDRATVARRVKAKLNETFPHHVVMVDVKFSAKAIQPQEIINKVIEVYGVDEKLFHSSTRKIEVMFSVHAARYFLFKYSNISKVKIGRLTRGTDHTTVINSLSSYEGLLLSRHDIQLKHDILSSYFTNQISNAKQ